jgi:hypothetical protein
VRFTAVNIKIEAENILKNDFDRNLYFNQIWLGEIVIKIKNSPTIWEFIPIPFTDKD